MYQPTTSVASVHILSTTQNLCLCTLCHYCQSSSAEPCCVPAAEQATPIKPTVSSNSSSLVFSAVVMLITEIDQSIGAQLQPNTKLPHLRSKASEIPKLNKFKDKSNHDKSDLANDSEMLVVFVTITLLVNLTQACASARSLHPDPQHPSQQL